MLIEEENNFAMPPVLVHKSNKSHKSLTEANQSVT